VFDERLMWFRHGSVRLSENLISCPDPKIPEPPPPLSRMQTRGSFLGGRPLPELTIKQKIPQEPGRTDARVMDYSSHNPVLSQDHSSHNPVCLGTTRTAENDMTRAVLTFQVAANTQESEYNTRQCENWYKYSRVCALNWTLNGLLQLRIGCQPSSRFLTA